MKCIAAVRREREIQTSGGSSDADFKRELDRRLDQALEDTFPASDPVSIVTSPTARQSSFRH
jgi:hypothetical protein